jgi:predicted AlkP superfamily phosphohydrolase/phosphomutase
MVAAGDDGAGRGLAIDLSQRVSVPLLIVGLDGASFEGLLPLCERGAMPTLSGLLERGAWGPLESVVPPITPAAWASFMTGKEPGRHGIFDFRVYDPRTYRDTFVSRRHLKEALVWEEMDRAARRVAVLNMPMLYPPPRGGVRVVSGFDTPSTEAAFTHPPELRTRILDAFPDYCFVAEPDPSDPDLRDERHFQAFMAAIERSLEQRTRVAEMLVGDSPPDVLAVHYQDVDALQHKAWREIVDPRVAPERAAAVQRVFERVDSCLARLIAALPGARVLVVSDHGFGDHTGRLFPNVLLERWGYLAWPGRWRARLERSLRKRFGGTALARRRGSQDWFQRVRTEGLDRALPVRWRSTRAYVALAEIYGLLYVNQRGREPEGIVAPGEETDRLVTELLEQFQAVRDPRDDTPVFERVLRGPDVYPDDPHGVRPDLVLVPRGGLSVYRDLNPKRWIEHYDISGGTHRSTGVLIAAGPGIRPGRVAAKLVDMAPTMLACVDAPVPDDLDGRVVAELFETPPQVRFVPPSGPSDVRSDAPGLDAEEEAQVRERLRALGYMT